MGLVIACAHGTRCCCLEALGTGSAAVSCGPQHSRCAGCTKGTACCTCETGSMPDTQTLYNSTAQLYLLMWSPLRAMHVLSWPGLCACVVRGSLQCASRLWHPSHCVGVLCGVLPRLFSVCTVLRL